MSVFCYQIRLSYKPQGRCSVIDTRPPVDVFFYGLHNPDVITAHKLPKCERVEIPQCFNPVMFVTHFTYTRYLKSTSWPAVVRASIHSINHYLVLFFCFIQQLHSKNCILKISVSDPRNIYLRTEFLTHKCQSQNIPIN